MVVENFNYKLCNVISYFLWHFNTEENSVELSVLALIKMIQYFVKLCVSLEVEANNDLIQNCLRIYIKTDDFRKTLGLI